MYWKQKFGNLKPWEWSKCFPKCLKQWWSIILGSIFEWELFWNEFVKVRKHWTHFSRWKIILMMMATSSVFIFEFLKWWIAIRILVMINCLGLLGIQVILEISKGKFVLVQTSVWNLIIILNGFGNENRAFDSKNSN